MDDRTHSRFDAKIGGMALLRVLAIAVLLAGAVGGTRLTNAADDDTNAALFGNDRAATDAAIEASTRTAADGARPAVERVESQAVDEETDPCPLDPPAPPDGIFEEPNRSPIDSPEYTPMERYAEQKALSFLAGFTVGEYPAVDEYDPFSPYCLGVEAALRAQREAAAGEAPSYDGTGEDRAVEFFLGYVTGEYPEGDGFDETHPYVQGVEERLLDDPVARAVAEQRAAELAAPAESIVEPSAGVYGATVYAEVAPAEVYLEPAPAAVYAPAPVGVYGEVAPSGAVYGGSAYGDAGYVEEPYVEESWGDVPVDHPPVADTDAEEPWVETPADAEQAPSAEETWDEPVPELEPAEQAPDQQW